MVVYSVRVAICGGTCTLCVSSSYGVVHGESGEVVVVVGCVHVCLPKTLKVPEKFHICSMHFVFTVIPQAASVSAIHFVQEWWNLYTI